MADDITKLNIASAVDSQAGTDPLDDDMFADTKSELAARFQLLPDDIKNVITDLGYQTKLLNIAKAEKMTYEELGILETETTMVLLGMTKPAEYRDELQFELKKNDPEIDTIVKAVNEQVFAPIRSSLERLYSAKKEPVDYIPDGIVSTAAEKAVGGAESSSLSDLVARVPASTPVSPWTATPAPASNPVPTTQPNTPSFSTSIARPSVANPMPFPSSLSSADRSVLEKTGVVIEQTPTPVVPTQAAPIPDRKDLLASIENPSRISSNIVAEKLKSAGPVISATKSTDYSRQAVAPVTPTVPAAPAPRASDPYREPIN